MSQILRVLLVDDSRDFSRPMQHQLLKEGFQVETASNGREAINKVKSFKGEFDVAVIDQVMGPPNGTEIMLRILQIYPMIEIIIMTGWGDMGPGEKAMELGAFRYISKMANAQELALNIRCAARFGRERQQRLSLQTLVSLGQKVGGIQNQEELYQLLFNEASTLLPHLDAFLVAHYERDDHEVSFPFSYRKGKRLLVPSRIDGNSITEYVLTTKESLLLANGDKEFREKKGLNPPHPNVGYSSSELVVPMFLEDHLYGVILASTFEQSVHYSEEHLQVLKAFASLAAVAIRHVQQLTEASQLQKATAALSSNQGKDAVLKAIVTGAHKLINSDFTGIILQDEDGTFRKVGPVIPLDHDELFREPRQTGGITRAVVESRRPIIIRDTQEEPLVKDSVRQAGIRSMLALPLIKGEKVLGVLYTHLLTLGHFGTHDVDLWFAFATQAAAALDRAIEDEKQIGDYARLANELGTLTQKMDLKDTLSRVATAAKEVFESDTCRLAYVDPPTGKIVNWAWADGDLEQYRFEGRPRPNGLTNYVLRSKNPVFRSVEDKEAPRPAPELVSRGLKSVATLPLIYNSRTIGILHCNYLTKRKPFNEHYRTLMEAFGAKAAIALYRVSRDHISDIWSELDREIVSCTDLKMLYKIFTEHAHQALNADLSIFYPYGPGETIKGTTMLLEEECIRFGDLRNRRHAPVCGRQGNIFKEISKNKTGLMIVNGFDQKNEKYFSKLATREKIKAFVAIRLEVLLPDSIEPRLAGILFLNFRTPTAIEPGDLLGLRYASDRVADGILRMNLQGAIQKAFKQRNDQLRVVIEVFREIQYESKELDLDLIARGAAQSLNIDACSFLTYDPKKEKFTMQGSYGLLHQRVDIRPRIQFKNKYMDSPRPTIISDVSQDKLMRESQFVKQEGVKSVVAYPLWVDGGAVGIFFANYRKHTEPLPEDITSIGLFVDLAARLLHASNLKTELNETQLKLDRRYFLVWVSMIEDSWRHSLIQKASSIRNHAASLRKRLSGLPISSMARDPSLEIVNDIDGWATEIMAAPPRVPHYWEMQPEFVPIAPLLQEVAEREAKPSLSLPVPLHPIRVDVESLGGVQVRGFRRWLIYLLETLLQNARNAMPTGGIVSITGATDGKWAEIRIQDSGNGVPKDIRDKLFKELIPRKQDRAGLGIGSLLAVTIVEEHRGNIELERPGPGDTTVLIRLPIARKTRKG